MEDVRDYFFCDSCENKDFKLIYNFYLRFHGVNFSDELIYDRVREKKYQCTNCNKTFSKNQVEGGLDDRKKMRKQQR